MSKVNICNLAIWQFDNDACLELGQGRLKNNKKRRGTKKKFIMKTILSFKFLCIPLALKIFKQPCLINFLEQRRKKKA